MITCLDKQRALAQSILETLASIKAKDDPTTSVRGEELEKIYKKIENIEVLRIKIDCFNELFNKLHVLTTHLLDVPSIERTFHIKRLERLYDLVYTELQSIISIFPNFHNLLEHIDSIDNTLDFLEEIVDRKCEVITTRSEKEFIEVEIRRIASMLKSNFLNDDSYNDQIMPIISTYNKLLKLKHLIKRDLKKLNLSLHSESSSNQVADEKQT